LIGGIFFDEGWNECGENNKYAEVYRFINDNTKRKYPGAFTVLNPELAWNNATRIGWYLLLPAKRYHG